MTDSKTPEDDAAREREIPAERTEVTIHRTVIDGRELAFTATAGTMHIRGEAHEAQASLFYVAYTVDSDTPNRPITFAFNGGPGSSAVWLHLGTLGPRRVDMPDVVDPGPPPHALVDNPDGVLDVTDLVFIDPVGTGFSRAVGKGEDKAWYGVEADVAAMTEFIWRYLQRSGRWNAPRFLAGESYGTTRAAALAEALQKKGLTLNGLALISPALNFGTFLFEPGNDLPYLLFLPTYAATAWYHHKLPDRPAQLAPFLDEVRLWVEDHYAPALMKGARLEGAAARAIAEQLHRYIGLDVELLLAMELRPEAMHFTKALLGVPGQTVGRLDARYVGPDTDALAAATSRDPSFDAPYGPYAALINHYLRRTLKFDPTEAYEVFSFAANEGWRWQTEKLSGHLDVTDALRKSMLQNPHLKVLVANGYFDVATPFFGAEYSMDHLGLDRARRPNIRLTYYESGHMMYLHGPSRAKLRADLVAWFTDACTVKTT